MKHIFNNLTLALLLLIQLTVCSCRKIFLDDDIANNPKENFEYLWNDIKNRYSYLDYKGLDWNAIHDEYSAQIHDGMSQEELFSVLANMMNEMKDGHVNLTSPFNLSIYFPITLNSPENYNGRLVLEKYLLRNPDQYYITGPIQNSIFDTLGVKVGYIRYRSFSEQLQPSDINYVVSRFNEENVDGVIIDVRSNGGGSVSNVFTFINRFVDSTRLAYISQIKTGPGAEDFGDDENVYIQPAGSKQFTKRIALLTNRGSYSATSLFTLAARSLPHFKAIGDSTGGGLGAPTAAELPNGWTYRFSVTRTLSPENDNWENGIPPDVLIDLDPIAEETGFDNIVERGVQYIITGE
jgi:C-terminal processing protease CtpA/Prc